VVIIPIVKKEADREPVSQAAQALAAAAKAAGLRVKVRPSARPWPPPRGNMVYAQRLRCIHHARASAAA
jgi:hypothetical protein